MMATPRRVVTVALAALAVACNDLPTGPSGDELDPAGAQAAVDADWYTVTGPFQIYTPPVPGTFDFRDGTTQGWTLLQLYRSTGGPVDSNRVTVWQPGYPGFAYYTPFSLGNPQRISLMANASSVAVNEAGRPRVDIYFQSPDLSGTASWRGNQGYELDVMRSYDSFCGDPIGYRVQLQVVVKDNGTGQQRVFADATQHRIDYYRNYRLGFRSSVFNDARYTVQFLRIRMMMPWPNRIECGTRGAWYIGNVKPTR